MTSPRSPEPASTSALVGWIDGHLDIAYLGVCGRAFDVRVADPDAGCVSQPDLADAPVRLALATIFTESRAPGQPAGYRDSDDIEGAHAAGRAQLAWYLAEEGAGRIRVVRDVRDLDAAMAAPLSPSAPLPIVILMEGADPIRTPDEAAWWFDQGVRVAGMSWAYGSRYSGGNSNGGGLGPAGRDLVAAFDALGILHDASHLSDASLDELLETSPKRVVATHSNCRALLDPKERHLTDEQMRSIADRDGIVGLNLYEKFLAVGRGATIDDCVAHVERVANVIGRHRCGLGSDLDGGFPPTALPREIRHPRDYQRLATALAEAGWNERDVAGFRGENWLRVLRAALPRGAK
ncbi:MAG: membrane dipeptidase [Phycisphaerales bacterium]